MSTIRVMLVDSSKMIEFFSAGNRRSSIDLTRKLLSEGAYKEALKISIRGPKMTKKPEDIAEEFFDLTNNPNRQTDRDLFYGRQRSISVGDIVEVDCVQYLCAGIGWIRL